MAFTREDLAAYEKSAPPAAAATTQQESTAVPNDATDASATSDESSTSDADTSVTQQEDGSPADEADSATATADLDSESTDTDEADSKPVARSRAQERIEDLVTERNAYRDYGKHAVAEATRLREELETLKKGAGTTATTTERQSSTSVPSTADDPAPTMAEHKFDPDAWSKAHAEWSQRQIQKGIEAARQQDETRNTKKQQESEAETAKAEFQERYQKYSAQHKDFEVTMANPALPKLSEVAARLIVKSEHGPAILHALSKDIGLATRIAKMAPEQQAMAIGGLQAKIEAPVTTTTTKSSRARTVTNAPPPPRPIAAGTQPSSKSLDQMTMDEFVAHERAQKIKQRQIKQQMRSSMR